jgi:hypothetical protein
MFIMWVFYMSGLHMLDMPERVILIPCGLVLGLLVVYGAISQGSRLAQLLWLLLQDAVASMTQHDQ